MNKPLAFRIRPKTLDEVIGQNHIVGEDGILTNSIKSGHPLNVILYGSPGVGKTTIAEAYASSMKVKYIKLNAVTSNKKEIEGAIQECKLFSKAFIIMDEVHRLNKDKQDILLPFIEDGTIFLVGMTTQNPYMAINKALRSRCLLLEVKPLDKDGVYAGLIRALSCKDAFDYKVDISEEALRYIASLSAGDMRFALNYLEVASISYLNKRIEVEDVKKIMQVPNWQMDDNEDEHYDSVSALQKSIRGSDVDAALYYLARLCIVGDLDSIKRRLLVTAYEDVGLGNPQAVDRVMNAINTAELVGFPEAVIPLGFAVCDLALSPKSKASCNAIHAAVDYASQHSLDVMDYLKLTPVNVQEEDKYPYDRPDLWNKIQYLPELIKNMKFFKMNENATGSYEKAINENYQILAKIKRSSNLRSLKKIKK